MILDPSWYNRAGVERMLVRSGIVLIKYWFSVSDDEHRARLNCIQHLLSKAPYQDMTPPVIKL